MSRRDPRIAFQQMLSHAEEAVRLCEGRARLDLDSDRLLNLALVRLLEIIGEAANRVPVEAQLQYPQIPWLQIVGLRNRLIHGYDEVDFDILWEIITHDLPALINTLQKYRQ
jgi:uncharacterized protein with HEPN domain